MSATSETLLSAYPLEGCGVLVGKESAEGILEISSAVKVRNSETIRGADRYAIDPRDYLAIETDLAKRRDGTRIVGFFHGHPDAPARPSRVDLEMAQGLFDVARTFFVYAIASVDSNQVHAIRFWKLTQNLNEFVEMKAAPDL